MTRCICRANKLAHDAIDGADDDIDDSDEADDRPVMDAELDVCVLMLLPLPILDPTLYLPFGDAAPC